MPVVEHKQHFFLVHPCVRARKFYCWKIGTSLSNGCAEATKKMCAFHFDRLFWWYFFFIFLPLLLLQRFFANLTRFHIGVRACVSWESYWRGFREQQVSIEVEISYIIFFISFGKFDFWAVFLTHQKRYVCATAWTKITVWLLYGCDDGREREGATRKETKNKPCHHSWFLLLHFHFRSTWWFISDDSHNGEIIKRLNAHTHPLTQQRRLYTLCMSVETFRQQAHFLTYHWREKKVSLTPVYLCKNLTDSFSFCLLWIPGICAATVKTICRFVNTRD